MYTKLLERTQSLNLIKSEPSENEFVIKAKEPEINKN